MSRSTGWQAWNFLLVGAVGFVVDGGILMLMHEGFGFGLTAARAVSFPVAVTVTWLLNRMRTFADRKDARPGREWGRYALVNGVGAILNLLAFLWLVARFPPLAATPLAALAIAAALAMAFNFVASRQVAFRARPSS